MVLYHYNGTQIRWHFTIMSWLFLETIARWSEYGKLYPSQFGSIIWWIVGKRTDTILLTCQWHVGRVIQKFWILGGNVLPRVHFSYMCFSCLFPKSSKFCVLSSDTLYTWANSVPVLWNVLDKSGLLVIFLTQHKMLEMLMICQQYFQLSITKKFFLLGLLTVIKTCLSGTQYIVHRLAVVSF